ncbi:MAG: MarR family winged helix-turn-helix transcriptional regulator [Nitrospiraceae bacterium]
MVGTSDDSTIAPSGSTPRDAAEPGASSVQDRVTAGLAKVAMAIKSRAWRERGREWLPPLQAQTLRLLQQRRPTAMTVSALAAELAVTMPTVSEMLRVLISKHLVKKTQSTTDHRVYLIELTTKGTREASRLAEWPYLRAATTELSDDEQVTMLRGVVKVIRGLQQQGEIRTARLCVTCQYFRPHQHAGQDKPHHCDFVDAPFGDAALRIDCADHVPATPSVQDANWAHWIKSGN